MKNLFNKKEDFAYLLGVHLGDGCCYIGKGSYQFSVTSSDFDLCKICSDIVNSRIKKSGTIKTVKKNGSVSYHQLVVCSRSFVYEMVDLTGSRSRIPDFILDDPVTHVPFVQGVMDADGWISRVNASDGYKRYRIAIKAQGLWMEDLKNMMVSCGVKVGSIRKINQTNNKIIKEFCINTEDYCNKIGFRIKRKSDLAKEYLLWKKTKKK